MKYNPHLLYRSMVNRIAILAIVFTFCGTSSFVIAQASNEADNEATNKTTDNETASTSHLNLSSNECLKQLDDTDVVIASIAFKDGLNSAEQLNELIKRKPWGIGTPATGDEIKAQLEVQSPFLIITLTKQQVLTLDAHRDIIRWVLVQSTSTSCG